MSRQNSDGWKPFASHASGIAGLWLLVYITRWFAFGYEPPEMSKYMPTAEALAQLVLPYLWLVGLFSLAYKFKIMRGNDILILSVLAMIIGILVSLDKLVITMFMRSSAYLAGFGLIRFAFLVRIPPKPRVRL